MNNDLTELVFILDRSGSMYGLEQDTIGGYNAMLEKQKTEKGDVHITTILFNNQTLLIHDRVPLSCVKPMTADDYRVRGTTALLDAVGTTIERVNKIQNAEPEKNRADKVIFVITTDGFENSSKKFSYEPLKKLIESQQEELGWEFIFLGANMDAIKEAGKIGIRADRSASYVNDSDGIAANFASVGRAVTSMRLSQKGERIDGSWKKNIEENFRKRTGDK